MDTIREEFLEPTARRFLDDLLPRPATSRIFTLCLETAQIRTARLIMFNTEVPKQLDSVTKDSTPAGLMQIVR